MDIEKYEIELLEKMGCLEGTDRELFDMLIEILDRTLQPNGTNSSRSSLQEFNTAISVASLYSDVGGIEEWIFDYYAIVCNGLQSMRIHYEAQYKYNF